MPRRRLLPVLAVGLVLTGCTTTGSTQVQPVAAPAADPATSVSGSVWVADEGGHRLSVLDAATGEHVLTLDGLTAPHNVQAAADGASVWVVSGDGLLVALTADGTVRATAATEPHPAHVVAAPDGRVFVTSSDGRSLTGYDSALQPVVRVELPGSPHGLRLDANARTAVVANTGAGTLDAVDLGTGRLTASVPVGEKPIQVAVSDDGRWAYASVASTSEVVKVDLRAGAVVARTALPAAPAQVLLTGAGDLLTADQGTEHAPGSTVSVLDPETLDLRGRVTVGSGPHGLTADPTGRVAWVTNVYDDTVSAVDVRALRVLGTTAVGVAPNGVSWSPQAPARGTRDLGLRGTGDAHEHAADGGHAH
jgi:YVTN family beta-propeller protein